MSAERPGNPGQSSYWLAGSPASTPPHAYLDWLASQRLLGGFAPQQPEEDEEQPTFPVSPDDGTSANLGRLILALGRRMR